LRAVPVTILVVLLMAGSVLGGKVLVDPRPGPTFPGERQVVIPRQYRVRFVPGIRPQAAEDLLQRLGLHVVWVAADGALYVVRVPAYLDERDVVGRLRASQLVLSVDPDMIRLHRKEPVGPLPPRNPLP
jgi:hypothetical protein